MTDQNQKKRTGMASLAAAGEGEDFSVIDVPRSVGFAAAFVRVRHVGRGGGLLGVDGGLVLAILGLRFGFLAFTLLLAESKQSHDVPHFITVATVTSLAPTLNMSWEFVARSCESRLRCRR